MKADNRFRQPEDRDRGSLFFYIVWGAMLTGLLILWIVEGATS